MKAGKKLGALAVNTDRTSLGWLSQSVYPVASGLLLAVPYLFPPLFPLAWIAFVPLLFALRRSASLRNAFFTGLFAGMVTNLAGFYWLSYTIGVFGGYPYTAAWFVFLLFAVCSGLPFGLFSLLVRGYGSGPLSLFPPTFWVAIEFCFPLLFPWHLGNSQSYLLPLIQTADLVGPYGTSFLLVWANAVIFKLAASFDSRDSRDRVWKLPLKEAAAVTLVLLAVLLYGRFRLRQVELTMTAAPTLTLAAVQGNVSIQHKGKIAFVGSNLEAYRQLTKKVRGADLAIWPESAVEAWLPEGTRRVPQGILPQGPPTTPFLLFGARSYRRQPGKPDFRAFNSAFLADAEGRVLSRYHKQVLLAFGEYIPLGSFLSTLPGMPPIGEGFTPGAGPRTLDLSPAIRLGPLICYEDLMPWLSRGLVAEARANLLINLTNDAWFGDTAAPWQHARLSQWRAIETRRALVRATNAGLTTVINPRGELLETLPVFASGVLSATVPLMEGETFYVRFGDWFAWTGTILALAIVVLWRRRSAASENPGTG